MRYVTYYEEYPIYEPAEGGYYYSGNRVVEYERLSKRKAKAMMKEIWAECEKENAEHPDEDRYGEPHEWNISSDGNYIYRQGYHIGEGVSYVLERKLGSEKRGWHPYY